jgi:hypothetical protein
VSDSEIIRRYERRSAMATVMLALLRGLLQAVLFLVPLFCALVLLDRFTALSSEFRKGMWFVGVIGASGFFAHGFWPLTLFGIKARSRELARRTSLRTDDFEIAQDFMQRPTVDVSEDLKADYLARIAEALRSISATATFPSYPWKVRGLVCMAFVVVLPALPSPGLPSRRLEQPISGYLEVF